MAGVFELLMKPQKRAVVHSTSRADLKVLELAAAKEILQGSSGSGSRT
jgi:hypothetical protein